MRMTDDIARNLPPVRIERHVLDLGSDGLHLSTRERVLDVATSAFAERGFQATTIRDIAERARVNIAAINYHFRSKAELHAVVIDTALMRWSSEIVQLEDLAPDAGLEQAVTCLVAALIEPLIEREGNHHVLRLLAWEMLEQPRRQEPHADGFAMALAHFLQPHLPVETARGDALFLAHWLIGQCILLSPALRSQHLPLSSPKDVVSRISRLAMFGLLKA
jgi:AcrR family transcriptional regulator